MNDPKLNRKDRIGAILMVATLIIFAFAAGRMSNQSPLIPEPTKQTVTVSIPDSSMMQSAQNLTQELAKYKMQACTDAWVPGCATPDGPTTFKVIDNQTIMVTWHWSGEGCPCWMSVRFHWDGYGFRIVNGTGGNTGEP